MGDFYYYFDLNKCFLATFFCSKESILFTLLNKILSIFTIFTPLYFFNYLRKLERETTLSSIKLNNFNLGVKTEQSKRYINLTLIIENILKTRLMS